MSEPVPAFRERLSQLLLSRGNRPDNFPAACARVLDVIKAAEAGTAHRDDAITAAAEFVAQFPETSRGSFAKRLGVSNRVIKASAPGDITSLSVDLAEVMAGLWLPRPRLDEKRFRVAGGLLALASALPNGSRPDAGDPVEDEREPLMAEDLAAMVDRYRERLADAVERLGEDRLPSPELADSIYELLGLASELADGGEQIETLTALVEAGETEDDVDPVLLRANDLLRIEGPESCGELVARVRELAESVLEGMLDPAAESPPDHAVVAVLHDAISADPGVDPDYDALDAINARLREHRINPLMLAGRLGDLRIGPELEPSPMATTGSAEQSRGGAAVSVTREPSNDVRAAPDDLVPPGPAVPGVSADVGADAARDVAGAKLEPPVAADDAVPAADGTGVPAHADAAALEAVEIADADDSDVEDAAAPAETRAAAAIELHGGGAPRSQPAPQADGQHAPPAGPAARPRDSARSQSTWFPVVDPAVADARAGDGPEPPAPDSGLLAELVDDDPMLAALIVQAHGGKPDLAAALEAVALSRGLGDPAGATATELDRLLMAHGELPDRSHKDGPLLAAAAIGLALHAPEGSTLLVLAQPPAELTHSATLVEALQGIFAGVTRGALSPLQVGAAARQAQLEHERDQAVASAAELRIELPLADSRHGPAKRTWRELISPRGELGHALSAIAERTASVDEIRQLLSDWDDRDARLDKVAAEHGAGRGGKIVSGVRLWLLSRIQRVLDVAGEWLRTTVQLQSVGDGATDDRRVALAERRRKLAHVVDAAIADLDELIATAEALDAACYQALRDRLHEARQAIDGDRRRLPDLAPDAIRLAPLARAWDSELDVDGRPVGPASALIEDLSRAAQRSAPEAVRRQLEHGNVALARAALRVWATTAPSEDVERLESTIGTSSAELRAALEHSADDLLLRTARLLRFGIIDPARQARLAGILERHDELDAERFDLRERALVEITADLHIAEDSRLQELRAKLTQLPAEPADRGKIERLLDAGDFALAEDLLLRLERGERLGVSERPRLLEGLLDALALRAPDVRAMVDALGGGRDLPGFDCSLLSDEERRRVRAAIAAIGLLEPAARGQRRSGQTLGDHLRSIGEIAGLDVVSRSVKQTERSLRGLALATLDLIPGVARWRPPHHVSPDGPRQRRTHQLVIWSGAPVAQVLESLAANPGLPGLVIAAAPLSLDRRRQLEREARRRGASFLLIDAAVLLHAAIVNARDGVPPLDVVVATSMALGKTNPYTAAGAVHHEMFMGRRTEAENVRDFGRAATVFGGRQLGKSALLRDIERAVNDPGDESRSAAVRARYIDLKREGVGDRLPPEALWSVIATSLAKAGVRLFEGRRTHDEVVEGIERYLAEPRNELRLFLDEADEFLRLESQTKFPNVYGFRRLLDDYPDRFKVVFAGLHSVNRFRRIPNQPLAQLGAPERIGPLKWDEARELVLTPLEALGFRFDDEALVDLILVETRRHANLIQFACKRLVDHVSARAETRGECAPLVISREDLAEIFERDDSFREWLRERFELTLNLYRHYKVLALILAMEAHADDAVRLEGLSLRDLERLAHEWWPEGFAAMTPDEFTVLVEEMENLEVLAVNRATGLYRLPSVNLIRLLGGSDEIERHLIAEIERAPEDADDGAQHDRRRDGERHSALTYEDERRLFGVDGRPVTLLFGNAALGVETVLDDLEHAGTSSEWGRSIATGTLSVGDALPSIADGGVFAAHLVNAGHPLDEVLSWLQELTPDVDQRIVLVLDATWLPQWLELLYEVEVAAPERLQTMILKRWNAGAFRRWLEELGANAERADQWFSATGGFHLSVRELDGGYLADRDADDRAQFADLVANHSGLDHVSLPAAVLRELADVGLASASDLRELIGPDDHRLVDVDDAARLLSLLGLVHADRDGYAINEAVPATEVAARL